MNWQAKMNDALDYIEENLTGNIKLDHAARFVGCSVWEFQRLFSFVTHVTLGEYIRGRKLALAANALQTSEEKIVDIGMKYGYESPAEFARAFGRQYGIPPSAARSAGVALTPYPKIVFETTNEERIGSMGTNNNIQLYSDRGYYVMENEPRYISRDIEKTIGWFRDVLGWFGGVLNRDDNGIAVYGGVHDFPRELAVARTFPISGFQIFKGEPLQGIVGYIHVKGLTRLHQYVLNNGWEQISEVQTLPYGMNECSVTTIDGCIICFGEGVEN